MLNELASPLVYETIVLRFCLNLFSKAQGTGEVYAAPGMPVRLQRPIAPVLKRGNTGLATAKINDAITSPVFTRFWHQPEPGRTSAAAAYYRFQNQQVRYPSISLRAGVGGKISARLTVLANGKVSAVAILRRELDEAALSLNASSPAAEAALEAEVIRVVSQIRFEPGTGTDTVTVSQRFRFE